MDTSCQCHRTFFFVSKRPNKLGCLSPPSLSSLVLYLWVRLETKHSSLFCHSVKKKVWWGRHLDPRMIRWLRILHCSASPGRHWHHLQLKIIVFSSIASARIWTLESLDNESSVLPRYYRGLYYKILRTRNLWKIDISHNKLVSFLL